MSAAAAASCRPVRSSTSAKAISGGACVRRDAVFSLLGPVVLRGKSGVGFRQRAVGGRLQLTRDDLVRCERALSNLGGNKLKVIFYETSVPGCLRTPPPSLPRCTVSSADVFIKSAAVAHKPTRRPQASSAGTIDSKRTKTTLLNSLRSK